MAEPYPNVTGAQYASVRQKVDPRFLDVVRRLEDSYYGTALELDAEGSATSRAPDGWKHGASHPFVSGAFSHDVRPTLRDSKALFDKLHGLIWRKHAVAMVDQNIVDGSPFAGMDAKTVEQEQPRQPQDAEDEVRFKRVVTSRKADAEQAIAALRDEGIEIEAI